MLKMAEHFQELRNWKRADISAVASRVIEVYSHALSQLGFQEYWDRFEAEVVDSIQIAQEPAVITLKWNSFELNFKPPTNHLIPIVERNLVVWRSRDPRFVVFPNPNFEGCEEFNYLRQANAVLAHEAASMDLEIVEDPFSLIFPGKAFAGVEIRRATLVNPQAG